MFELGFWELLLIGVVALLVVGPERLPGLARTAGRWVGRVRRFVATVKADIDREVRAEELRKVLNKQNEFKDAYDVVEDTRKDVYDIVENTKKEVEKEVGEVVSELNRPDGNVAPTLPDKSEKTASVESTQADGEKRSAG